MQKRRRLRRQPRLLRRQLLLPSKPTSVFQNSGAEIILGPTIFLTGHFERWASLTTQVQMSPLQSHRVPGRPTSFYWSGDTIRSRSVSEVVLSGMVDVPAPSARLMADWKRETSSRLGLEPGDVEALPLARARARWPDYRHCVQAVSDWTLSLGLHEVLASSDVALMACLGAKYHHDAAHYGGMAFCNLFLSEDRGLDLHFPSTGQRIPLARGAVVIFDTGQRDSLA